MRPVRVPAPHRETIKKIGRLNEEVFNSLVAALSKSDEPMGRAHLRAAIDSSLSWGVDDSGVLLDALLGAHSVLQRRQDSPADVAASIASDTSLRLGEGEREAVSSRLSTLLGLERLAALSRASRLMAADAQTFCRARTLSDLRPVFVAGSDPPKSVGTIIRHTLQIHYHTDGPETEPFFLSVDKSGLRALRDAIDRALAKDGVLRDMEESSGLRVIDVEEAH
jgi:hypothetical protein